MVEAGVYPETPNPDGSCNDGWASTPMGRALQMYTISASPEEHNQATNNYLPCLAAEALKAITAMQAASVVFTRLCRKIFPISKHFA
ncbi:MAG: hypothetical protein WBE68_27015 [Candidatus Nitrosopolaris sp.]